MLKVKSIDHVAIAVPDLAPTAAAFSRLFGLRAGAPELVGDQKTEVMFLHTGKGDQTGEAAVELICPAGNAGLERFLDRRGQALHHVCFEVDDLQAALAELKAQGVALIDETPRPGARGHLVAFLHPKATGGVLFELCQKERSI
jgi:methylmalonyl-CoA/ethylmalonyl-CoA epimerase